MINYALIMIAIGVFAGFAGAILGLGGGIILTPILTLLMGVDIKYAIGASIVAVIATSSGATIAYLRDKVLNLRVAMFLEIATTLGALSGALLTGVINPKYLYILFGLLLLFSGYNMIRKLIATKRYYTGLIRISCRLNFVWTALISTMLKANKSIIRWNTFPAVLP